MKNGFSKFQNKLISEVRRDMRDGATLDACSMLIGISNDVSETYVQELFISWRKMQFKKELAAL